MQTSTLPQTSGKPFLCPTGPWKALRLLVGLKPDIPALVFQILHDSQHSSWYVQVAHRIDAGFQLEDLQTECLPGFEVLRTLSKEQDLLHVDPSAITRGTQTIPSPPIVADFAKSFLVESLLG